MMIDLGTLGLLCLLVFALGVFAGQGVADYRRARKDAERVMRTRSNYRRSKQK